MSKDNEKIFGNIDSDNSKGDPVEVTASRIDALRNAHPGDAVVYTSHSETIGSDLQPYPTVQGDIDSKPGAFLGHGNLEELVKKRVDPYAIDLEAPSGDIGERSDSHQTTALSAYKERAERLEAIARTGTPVEISGNSYEFSTLPAAMQEFLDSNNQIPFSEIPAVGDSPASRGKIDDILKEGPQQGRGGRGRGED